MTGTLTPDSSPPVPPLQSGKVLPTRHVQSGNDSWLGAVKMLGKLMLSQLLHFVFHTSMHTCQTVQKRKLRLAGTIHHQ